MIDSRLQQRAVAGTASNAVQRCEGCLAATAIANNGWPAGGSDYIAHPYRSQNADAMCWMRCIDRL